MQLKQNRSRAEILGRQSKQPILALRVATNIKPHIRRMASVVVAVVSPCVVTTWQLFLPVVLVLLVVGLCSKPFISILTAWIAVGSLAFHCT